MKVISNRFEYITSVQIQKIIFITDDYICFYKNSHTHREDGPAIIPFTDKPYSIEWTYKSDCYGYGDDFTNETWKKKVKELKRKEKLRIFK